MTLKFFQLSILLLFFSLLPTTTTFADGQEKRGLNWKSNSLSVVDDFKSGAFRAIIVGNNIYSNNKTWRNLTTAVNDAEKLANVLENDYGFTDVVLLKNASRKTILGELKSMSKRVMVNDNVLVYYAGHGHMDEDERRGYWVPSDGAALDDTTFIRNSTIRDEISILAEKTKHTLLLSDSCFSGSLLRGGNRGPTQFDLSQNYYTKVGNKKSVQVLAAGGNEYVDDNYRESGHSPFTYFLLNELKNNTQEFISLSELAVNIIKAVSNNVDQTPETGVLAGAGDELGEFIFIRASLKDNVVNVLYKKEVVTENETINKFPEPDRFLPAFRF